jgi:hypothetical protein
MCSQKTANGLAYFSGGVFMRFVKVVCLVMLIAVSGAAAWAGSIGGDPTITINGKKPGTGFRSLVSCPAGFTCFTAKGSGGVNAGLGQSKPDPIIIPFTLGGLNKYEFLGTPSKPGPLTFPPGFFWVEITGIPSGEGFACGGNVFSPACAQFITITGGGSTFTDEFRFADGTLVAGEQLSISQSPNIDTVPEPGTILMFMSLVPAIGFAKKRWNAIQSA